MSATGDALKAASDNLHDSMVSSEVLEAAEWKVRYAALRDTLSAYIDAVDAVLTDYEARLTALEP